MDTLPQLSVIMPPCRRGRMKRMRCEIVIARKERRAQAVVPKDELAGHELFRKKLY